MVKNFLSGLFGGDSERALARVRPVIERCNALEPELMKLTDAELRAKTDEFKARLADGSRVNVIAPPLALDGPTLTIRKFKKDKLRLQDLVKFGSITPEGAKVLEIISASRCNVLISGGTGSGKTTLLNCLTAFIGPEERIVTCEDAAELQLQQPHVVRLETRLGD